jgi:group I intron endonuclease
MKHGYIYIVTNTVNGKRYVGQTRGQVKYRWAAHVKGALAHNNDYAISHAIRKYGIDAFSVRTLCKAAHCDLNFFEGRAVAILNTIAPAGYNLTPAGDSFEHTAETRAKISAANMGRTSPNKGKPQSEETKAKLSLSVKAAWADPGKGAILLASTKAAHTGMKHTELTRAKMSAAGKGRKKSAEHIAKIAATHTGMKRSPQAVENIRAGQIGKKASHLARSNMRDANRVTRGQHGIGVERYRGKRHDLFRVRVKVLGKTFHVGSFSTAEEAQTARRQWLSERGM